MSNKSSRTERCRYGIGEWYGKSFVRMTQAERRTIAQAQMSSTRHHVPCLPRGERVLCNKPGGVCSIRMYQRSPNCEEVSTAPDTLGQLVTTCPCRFEEDETIFRWIGEVLLDYPAPFVVGEVGFLERESSEQSEAPATEDVGRIDNVLVRPGSDPMQWCALEIQAVYFSGPAMSHEFRVIADHASETPPFPIKLRRPDFRSSGPKRLMPQLQVKVPTLRRWGKKMAVVVDETFFSALGKMENVAHVSNADIAWFVVNYDETSGEARLKRDFVHLTTLERAVEGLTAGHPVTLETFETRIREKLDRVAASRRPSRDPDL